MTIKKFNIILTTIFVVMFTVPISAFAQEEEEVGDMMLCREFFSAGVELYGNHDYESALEVFNEAHILNPNWAILYNVGKCHVMLKQYGVAIDIYEQCLVDSGANINQEEKAEILNELAVLRNKIGNITVEGSDNIDIYIDGINRGKTPLKKRIPVTYDVNHKYEYKLSGTVLQSGFVKVERQSTVILKISIPTQDISVIQEQLLTENQKPVNANNQTDKVVKDNTDTGNSNKLQTEEGDASINVKHDTEDKNPSNEKKKKYTPYNGSFFSALDSAKSLGEGGGSVNFGHFGFDLTWGSSWMFNTPTNRPAKEMWGQVFGLELKLRPFIKTDIRIGIYFLGGIRLHRSAASMLSASRFADGMWDAQGVVGTGGELMLNETLTMGLGANFLVSTGGVGGSGVLSGNLTPFSKARWFGFSLKAEGGYQKLGIGLGEKGDPELSGGFLTIFAGISFEFGK